MNHCSMKSVIYNIFSYFLLSLSIASIAYIICYTFMFGFSVARTMWQKGECMPEDSVFYPISLGGRSVFDTDYQFSKREIINQVHQTPNTLIYQLRQNRWQIKRLIKESDGYTVETQTPVRIYTRGEQLSDFEITNLLNSASAHCISTLGNTAPVTVDDFWAIIDNFKENLPYKFGWIGEEFGSFRYYDVSHIKVNGYDIAVETERMTYSLEWNERTKTILTFVFWALFPICLIPALLQAKSEERLPLPFVLAILVFLSIIGLGYGLTTYLDKKHHAELVARSFDAEMETFYPRVQYTANLVTYYKRIENSQLSNIAPYANVPEEIEYRLRQFGNNYDVRRFRNYVHHMNNLATAHIYKYSGKDRVKEHNFCSVVLWSANELLNKKTDEIENHEQLEEYLQECDSLSNNISKFMHQMQEEHNYLNPYTPKVDD